MMRLLLPPLHLATPAYWRQRAYLDAVSAVARSHLGVKQARPGVFGDAVCAIIDTSPRVSCDSYEAWCQHFAFACCEVAAEGRGARTVYPHALGGVARAWHQSGVLGLRRISAADALRGVLPSVGWIMMRTRDGARRDAVLRGGSAPGHCGVVVEMVTSAHCATVDGNTNSSGSATGGEVGRNVVSYRDPRLLGFVEPAFREVKHAGS
jgi:hypothetical protein